MRRRWRRPPPPSGGPGVKRGVNVSSARTYLLKLPRSVKASVRLTGMTIDFDCRVGIADCSNHGESRDDSWSGSLAAGAHAVTVYPYERGPGNYSLAVTATRTLHRVVQPFGAPEIKLFDDNEDGADGSCIKIHDSITVTAPPPTLNPPQPPPPPPPPPSPPPGPAPGTGGTPTERPSGGSLAAATSDINCKGWNIDAGDGFDALRRNRDGTTRKHGALDIQVSSKDAAFFALAAGTMTNRASSPIAVPLTELRNGPESVSCCIIGCRRKPQ